IETERLVVDEPAEHEHVQLLIERPRHPRAECLTAVAEQFPEARASDPEARPPAAKPDKRRVLRDVLDQEAADKRPHTESGPRRSAISGNPSAATRSTAVRSGLLNHVARDGAAA